MQDRLETGWDEAYGSCDGGRIAILRATNLAFQRRRHFLRAGADQPDRRIEGLRQDADDRARRDGAAKPGGHLRGQQLAVPRHHTPVGRRADREHEIPAGIDKKLLVSELAEEPGLDQLCGPGPERRPAVAEAPAESGQIENLQAETALGVGQAGGRLTAPLRPGERQGHAGDRRHGRARSGSRLGGYASDVHGGNDLRPDSRPIAAA